MLQIWQTVSRGSIRSPLEFLCENASTLAQFLAAHCHSTRNFSNQDASRKIFRIFSRLTTVCRATFSTKTRSYIWNFRTALLLAIIFWQIIFDTRLAWSAFTSEVAGPRNTHPGSQCPGSRAVFPELQKMFTGNLLKFGKSLLQVISYSLLTGKIFNYYFYSRVGKKNIMYLNLVRRASTQAIAYYIPRLYIWHVVAPLSGWVICNIWSHLRNSRGWGRGTCPPNIWME
jgi:Zn-dependent protease with chaperone function